MILVIAGTNPFCFGRLLRPMDNWTRQTGIEVFAQVGNSSFEPASMKFERFVERHTMLALIDQAEIVVTHGGFGSLRDCLSVGKRIVAVPRYSRFDECLDNQEELVRALDETGRVVAVYDISDLEDALETARGFRPSVCEKSSIPSIIEEYLRGAGR